MHKQVVILDACVLYPFYVRDFFMRLASEGELFQARWSNEILEEVTRNIILNKPHLKKEALERTIALMNLAVPDALVSIEAFDLSALSLPDLNDRHVLAAAINANARIIATFNLKDFPPRTCSYYGIIAMHPDDFALTFAIKFPEVVSRALNHQAASFKNPPLSGKALLEILE